MKNTQIDIKALARLRTPDVPTILEKDFHRHDVIQSLKGHDNVGIELGVAGGHFSQRMIDSGKFKCFYGVDLYADHHDTKEYLSALRLVGLEKNYRLLRMSFDDALSLFEDNYFDFIYFDGYAHTGEDGGKPFTDWYSKIKVGGVIAGDDYHDDWPLVKWAVNKLVQTVGAHLHVTGQVESVNLSRYPSWFFTKQQDFRFDKALDDELLSIGQQIRASQPAKREINLTMDEFLRFLHVVCEKHPETKPKLMEIIAKGR